MPPVSSIPQNQTNMSASGISRNGSFEKPNDPAMQILRLLQEEFMVRFPAFPEIFGQLAPVCCRFAETENKNSAQADAAASYDKKNPVPGTAGQMEAALGTDGSHLFYEPSLLCEEFLQSPDRLRRSFLHAHIHCLELHMFRIPPHTQRAPHNSCPCGAEEQLRCSTRYTQRVPRNSCPCGAEEQLRCSTRYTQRASLPQENLWDLACDLSAELTACLLLGEDPDRLRDRLHAAMTADFLTQTCAKRIKEVASTAVGLERNFPDAAELLPILQTSFELRNLAKQCSRDAHRFWYENRPNADSGSLGRAQASAESDFSSGHFAAEHRHSFFRLQEAAADQWLSRRSRLNKVLSNKAGQRNGQAGTSMENADLHRQDEMDYRKFLHQFAVPREEPILDTDSFDYIPYCCGLERYGNMPFLEPLEYSEVNRLDEFAIAIDTSGSCSGRIVRRFLEETWNILRQKENFFSKMRLHLIQCDSMIQDHRIITSVEQWEAALPDLKILGLGNTDFRPVFDYLNTLIRKKEIRRLRGLLYFTDGDGIYPRNRPSFDTAFVFLNRRLEKQKIPDWGIRLNLDLPETFES